ncbi:hypothetical protein RI367_001203 [Sorochytrium milnesiophthora]
MPADDPSIPLAAAAMKIPAETTPSVTNKQAPDKNLFVRVTRQRNRPVRRTAEEPDEDNRWVRVALPSAGKITRQDSKVVNAKVRVLMSEYGDVDEVLVAQDGHCRVLFASASAARRATAGKIKARDGGQELEMECTACPDPAMRPNAKRVKLTGLLPVHTADLLKVMLQRQYGAVEEVYVHPDGYRPWAMVTFASEEVAVALLQAGSCSVSMFNLLAWKPDANVREELIAYEDLHAVLVHLPPKTIKDAYLTDLMVDIGAVCWQLRRSGRQAVIPLVDVWFGTKAQRDHGVTLSLCGGADGKHPMIWADPNAAHPCHQCGQGGHQADACGKTAQSTASRPAPPRQPTATPNQGSPRSVSDRKRTFAEILSGRPASRGNKQAASTSANNQETARPSLVPLAEQQLAEADTAVKNAQLAADHASQEATAAQQKAADLHEQSSQAADEHAAGRAATSQEYLASQLQAKHADTLLALQEARRFQVAAEQMLANARTAVAAAASTKAAARQVSTGRNRINDARLAARLAEHAHELAQAAAAEVLLHQRPTVLSHIETQFAHLTAADQSAIQALVLEHSRASGIAAYHAAADHVVKEAAAKMSPSAMKSATSAPPSSTSTASSLAVPTAASPAAMSLEDGQYLND